MEAPTTKYQLDVYKLPTGAGDFWKAVENPLAVESSFRDNMVINEIQEVTLETAPRGEWRNYLAVGSINIERVGQEDRGHYSSTLSLY